MQIMHGCIVKIPSTHSIYEWLYSLNKKMMSIFSEFNSADFKDRSMTNVLNTYNFMDLLKEYNYVPETDRSEIRFPENIAALVEYFTDLVRSKTEDYDFMDLLGDKGYVPVNDNWVKSRINKKQDSLKIAS